MEFGSKSFHSDLNAKPLGAGGDEGDDDPVNEITYYKLNLFHTAMATEFSAFGILPATLYTEGHSKSDSPINAL